MRYLKISNQGLLDPRLIFLMGGTTKLNDPSKVGRFGTGLKYAISHFISHKIDFRLFVGEDEILFNTEVQDINGNQFEEIYCNGKSMNITTHYGHQWKTWESIREVWCNSIDEGDAVRTIKSLKVEPTGAKGRTTFFISMTKEVKDVTDNWSNYFIDQAPLFENEKFAIYKNTGEYLKLYKNTVLIESSQVYKSLFVYDIKQAELNELRQYRGYNRYDIGEALLNSNKAVIDVLFEAIAKGKDLFEVKMDWSSIPHQKDVVKKLFTGYLFLHPESDGEIKGRSLRVNLSLFELLEKAGLICEKIKKSYGGYYSSSGTYSTIKLANYKEVKMPELEARIKAIQTKYNTPMKFIIAVPIKCDFEMITEKYGTAIFSADLDRLSDDDLESVILIGMLAYRENNMYKVLKRLVKILYKKSYFKSIFFGTSKEKKEAVAEFGDIEELLHL